MCVLFKAICQEECINGGRCVGPDKCACPYGFTGDRCQQGNMTSNVAFLCFRFHFSLRRNGVPRFEE